MPTLCHRRPRVKPTDDSPRTPFLILTGFLGAGKTTLVNRLLSAPAGRRIAVLINDLGAVHIDRKLVTAQSGDLIELSGGCVCCKLDLQRDLWISIEELLGRARPDHLVLETTGIAEPHLLVERFFAEQRDERGLQPPAVVCCVDGEAGLDQLDRHREPRSQLAHATRGILSKLDRTSHAQAMALRERLHALRPDLALGSFPATSDGTAALVSWLLDAPPVRAHGSAPAHLHRHQLTAASFRSADPLLGPPLLALCDRFGARLVRVKGFVHLAGERRRAYLERAGRHTTLTLGDEWGRDAANTELVFIGEDIDESALRAELWACRAAV
jgi:G3E family GTPase